MILQTDASPLVLLIPVGVFAQIALMLYPWRPGDGAKLAWSGFAALLGFIPGKEGLGPIGIHLFLACAIFIMVAALALRDRLLPWLQEGAVLLWTGVFLYALVTVFGFHSYFTGAAALAAVIAVIVVLYTGELSFFAKLSVYTWFLVMIVTLGGLQLRWGDYAAIYELNFREQSAGSVVIDSMAMTYFGVHAAFLFRILPIPGKTQSIKERMQEWHDDTNAMVARLSDAPVNPNLAIGVLGLVLAAGFVNLNLKLVDPWLFINCILVGIPIVASLARGRMNPKTSSFNGPQSESKQKP